MKQSIFDLLMMERARNVNGPYDEIRQLSHVQAEFNEPNQGGLIQTQLGNWYFLTHHGTGDWSGRAVSLLPVNWRNGWPLLGKTENDSLDSMVWQNQMPLRTNKLMRLRTNDEFNSPHLSLQWEWNYPPRRSKWSLTERKGWLRLKAFQPLEPDELLKAGNTLTQRTIRTRINSAVGKMITGMKKHSRSLIYFQKVSLDKFTFAILKLDKKCSLCKYKSK